MYHESQIYDMNINKKLSRLFNESIIDPTRRELDPDIFDEVGKTPKMKEYIRSQIEEIIDEIDKELVPINDWFIKGSILSYQWLPWSDVDILIEIDDMPDEEWDELRKKIYEKYENVTIAGTNHPVQIFPQRGDYPEENADGIYDVKSGTWIKGPYDMVVDINDYLEGFTDKAQSFDMAFGELERDVIDYTVLQSLTSDEISALSDQAKDKLNEIDRDIDLLIQKRDEIKDARWAAFSRDMTPEELQQYASKNELPANVVQKMLERYRYFGAISQLKQAKEDSAGTIDKPQDVERIKLALDKKAPALESRFRSL